MATRLTPDRRRAPLALLHSPPLLAGCLAAAVLVVFAAASGLLFTTAAGSAAFADKIAQITPLGAGVHLTRSAHEPGRTVAQVLSGHERRGRAVAAAVGVSPWIGRQRATLLAGPFAVRSGSRSMDVYLVARDGAEQHVRRLAGGGDGLWIADSVAAQVRVRPGQTVRLEGPGERSPAVRVGAVYRALWKDVANDDWVNFSQLIYPRGVDPGAPPTFALTSPRELVRLAHALGDPAYSEFWELPVAVDGMTLDRARALGARFAVVERGVADPRAPLAVELGCGQGLPFHQTRCAASSSLGAAVRLADESADAVAAPARLLGGVGLAITLAVAAAVGVFLVTRRRGEARHRFARGESAGAFAARTAVEASPALLAGGAAGFGLTLLLVRALEPDAALDGASLGRPALAAGVAVAAGAILLVGAATATFLRQFDTEPRSLRGLRLVPWELALLGGGAYLLAAIRHGSGLSGSHPSLFVFAMPLLMLAGATGLVLRVVRLLLARTDGGPVPAYLAARRAAAAPALLVALTILCAVSLGVLFYGRALTASLEHGTRQKARIAIGGDVQGAVDAGATLPRLPFPATVVRVAYGGAAIGSAFGPQVDLMEIDPASFAGVLRWDGAWGRRPDLARLTRLAGGRVPVVVVAGPARLPAIWLSGERLPVEVVARVGAFPGMSTQAPLIVAARSALVATAGGGSYDPLEGGLAYVWANGPPRQVERALTASLLRPDFFLSVDDVLRDPDVAAAGRTYSFLTALGVAVAALALVGVALYLYARQRSQTIASALARRMGLSRRSEVLSLWLELTAVLLLAAALAAGVGLAAAAPVIARTDPLPGYAPAPSFVLPWPVLALTLCVLLAVALAAALATSAAARRTDVAQELRLG